MSKPVHDSQFARFRLEPTVRHDCRLPLFRGCSREPFTPHRLRARTCFPWWSICRPSPLRGHPAGPIADLLRLNTGVTPTAPGSASRLGLLAGDGAGYPNGRRLADDVVDIVLRVAVGGVLAGNKCGAGQYHKLQRFSQ